MQKVNNNYIFLFVLVLAITPYCYLCFFTNPSADDFSFSAQAQNNDLLHLLYANYFVQNGRYISNIFVYLNPLVFGSYFGYKLVSFALIILSYLSVLFFISQTFHQKSKLFKCIASLLFLLIFFQNIPIISEGIYWYTGSTIYTLGTLVFLTYIAFFIKAFREKKKGISIIFLTLLLLFSCGFNEVLTLLIVFLLTVLTAVFYKNNLMQKRVVLFQLLFAVIFATILIFAPGNSIRGNSYPESHQFIYSLSYSFLQVARFTLLWVASIPLIISSILYFWINKRLSEEEHLFKNSFFINRWVSLFFLLAITFICVFPAYWATGMLGQHRTLNVAYSFFIIMWFVNLTVWYNYYQNRFQIQFLKKYKKLLMGLLILGIVFTGNGFNALQDVFSGSATMFNTNQNKRFKQLSKAKESKINQLVLTPIKAKPNCLFTYDITSDPTHWKNQAYNMYFRLDSVEIFLK